MHIYRNYSLLGHNTFRLSVRAKWFVEYESEADLKKIFENKFFSSSQPIYHIGKGSNILFLDDFDGIIIHSRIKGIEIIEENAKFVRIKVGAAEEWDIFVAYCVNRGWGGVENLSAIPGEIGASAFQNIGAYGVEVSSVIDEVHFYSKKTGEKQIFSSRECKYSYRNSFFKQKKELFFITHVVYRLLKNPIFQLHYNNLFTYLDGEEINLQSIRRAIIFIRQSRLPNLEKEGNAGSFFLNPCVSKPFYENLKKYYFDIPFYPVNKKTVKISAAWLIEKCVEKKKFIGNAAIYEKQSLVIINKGHASGKEIAQLAWMIIQKVRNTFGIELQTEVTYL